MFRPVNFFFSRLPAQAGIFFIRAYQLVLGPFLGGRCRFYPSCSEYGIESLRVHGLAKGTWLIIIRIARCHPLSRGGVDMVPPGRAVPDHPFACHGEKQKI